MAALPIEDTEDTARHTVPWVLGDVLPAASPGARTAGARPPSCASPASCQPASELQLSAFRAAVRTADDPTCCAAGSPAPDGIDVDLDLRWRLLVQLATLGGTDRAELDAALAADADPPPRRSSTPAPSRRSRPRRPRSWRGSASPVPVESPTTSSRLAGFGLWRGDPTLTRPYVERYVADLPAPPTCAAAGCSRSPPSRSSRPATSTPETVALVKTLVPAGVLEPAVRRRVVDEIAALERRLAVRAAFPKHPLTGAPGVPVRPCASR